MSLPDHSFDRRITHSTSSRAASDLRKDEEIRFHIAKPDHDIDFPTLHQTTANVDMGDKIQTPLTGLQVEDVQGLAHRHARDIHTVSVRDDAKVHVGDVVYYVHQQEPDKPRALGLCLASAPLIDADNFVGRTVELAQMAQVLRPGEPAAEQRRLLLGGMGGIGKTQLAIAYARCYQSSYASVLWLNATTKLTLQASFRTFAQQLLTESELGSLDDEGVVRGVCRWLSGISNTQWLLIFDNHDDPDLFTIGDYMPNTAHGSCIVTTRLPDLVRGQQLRQVRVPPIDDLNESLKILQTRSQRQNVKHDPDARRLAERLAGLPLALATASAYLKRTTVTFRQYLETYDRRFYIDLRRPTQLQEYQDRTLYTTWDLTYNRLEKDDPLAAKALRLLAYFDHQDVWFELLHAGLGGDTPSWLHGIVGEHIDFENIMGVLVDYCLVEVHLTSQSYSIHSCVHDWALAQLNRTISDQLYWYAVKCVVAQFDENDWTSLGKVHYTRLARHALRYVHRRFIQSVFVDTISLDHLNQLTWIAELLTQQLQLSAAEDMYKRILAGSEKALGPDHTSTLYSFDGLGKIYREQGKLDEAEQMYERALAGFIKALGPDHTSTLYTFDSFGRLYRKQGKLDKAEQMYERALAGREKVLGPDHTSTLYTVDGLGRIYLDQGKLDKAEQMYERSLAGREKVLGADHISTLHTVNSLSLLYYKQGKSDEAEQMHMRALNLYANIVRSGTCHYAAIRGYATALSRSIKAKHADRPILLLRLLALVKQWKKDTVIFQELARLMVSYGDDKTAQEAYRYSVRHVDLQYVDFGGTYCDGCLQHITVPMGLHVCKQCLEIDLCDQCMVNYNNNTIALSTCRDHTFFDVDTTTFDASETETVKGTAEVDLWIDQLIAKYVAAGNIQSANY